MLLAYLIYHRSRAISRSELINLLLDDEEGSSDPINALKRLVHRARSVLTPLWPTAGADLILWKDNRYMWNTDYPMVLDTEEFDRICCHDNFNDIPTDELLSGAVMYTGDFLTQFSSDSWVLPISAYYHNWYVKSVLELMPRLEEQNRRDEASRLCRAALTVEPYSEEIYLHLFRNLVAAGNCQAAVKTYEKLRETLFSTFGVLPSEDIRAIYRVAVRSVSEWAIAPEDIHKQLREAASPPGALVCDYDFFRILYQSSARQIARGGGVIHIALLSVSVKDNTEMSRRSLEHATDNLLLRAQECLRRGDALARCSISQVIMMLPQANYEDSCMVCNRILTSFRQKHPHSPAQISFFVQPIEPADAPRND